MHTDPSGMGSNLNLGHVDFWPNNSTYRSTYAQPGCSIFGNYNLINFYHLAWIISFHYELQVHAVTSGQFIIIPKL